MTGKERVGGVVGREGARPRGRTPGVQKVVINQIKLIYLFIFNILFIFIFGHTGSSLLHTGFLNL